MNPRTRIEQYQHLKDLRRKGPLPEEARNIRTSEDIPSLREIRAYADEVFGDPEKAEHWFGHPNRSMYGQKPIDLMQDDIGAAVVHETLGRIDHGIFS